MAVDISVLQLSLMASTAMNIAIACLGAHHLYSVCMTHGIYGYFHFQYVFISLCLVVASGQPIHYEQL